MLSGGLVILFFQLPIGLISPRPIVDRSQGLDERAQTNEELSQPAEKNSFEKDERALSFEVNNGQADSSIAFTARGTLLRSFNETGHLCNELSPPTLTG